MELDAEQTYRNTDLKLLNKNRNFPFDNHQHSFVQNVRFPAPVSVELLTTDARTIKKFMLNVKNTNKNG